MAYLMKVRLELIRCNESIEFGVDLLLEALIVNIDDAQGPEKTSLPS